MVFSESGGTGLKLFHMGFVAWTYGYQAGSDRGCLSADLFLMLATRGPICHSDLFSPIEINHEENVLIEEMTTLVGKGGSAAILSYQKIHPSATEQVHRDLIQSRCGSL